MRGSFAHTGFSTGEEISHAVTHGFGVLGSLLGLVLMILKAAPRHDPLLMSGVIIFGSSMVLLYSASTMYHALTGKRSKAVFELMDHAAIYLLIAGTYTPFTMITLRGATGWTLLSVVWTLALLGILYEVVLRRPWKWLSLAFYLGLGWLLVVVAKPLMAALPTPALLLIAAGGLAYTGGAVFYAWRGFRYHHALWHICVLAGTGFHLVCVLKYVIPA